LSSHSLLFLFSLTELCVWGKSTFGNFTNTYGSALRFSVTVYCKNEC
jgi:hypothetical protein